MPARTPSPPAAAPDELAEIAAENPCHRVWRETTCDGIRYIAQSLDLGVHPHTLVTRSLPELRAALNASTPRRG
jgi:hypothetical protein